MPYLVISIAQRNKPTTEQDSDVTLCNVSYSLTVMVWQLYNIGYECYVILYDSNFNAKMQTTSYMYVDLHTI